MPYKDQSSQAARESQSRRNKAWYEKNKNKKPKIVVPKTKICPVCKEEKSWEAFYRRDTRASGLTSWCKECLKEHARKYAPMAMFVRRARLFGITVDEYMAIEERQKGVCAICKIHLNDLPQKSLCVDHCHKTGKVRGLLCHACNMGIGNLRDNIKNLKSAIKYLTL